MSSLQKSPPDVWDESLRAKNSKKNMVELHLQKFQAFVTIQIISMFKNDFKKNDLRTKREAWK